MATEADRQLESLNRRLGFRRRVHPGLEGLAERATWPAAQWLGRLFRWVVFSAHEACEFFRAGARLPRPGRPVEAALESGLELPQDPGQRAYWFDEANNALVGVVLGVDLVRHGDRYFVIELNTQSALNPERRELFATDLDPLVAALADNAARHGFRRLLMLRRHGWTEVYRREFERASKVYGVEVIGRSTAPAARDAMVRLPETLEPDTAYHVFSNWVPPSPLVEFLHDKRWSGRWMRAAYDRDPSRFRKLAYVPTWDEPVLTKQYSDERWPNLVLKLASSDMGRHVAMGRFADAPSALRDFGIPEGDPQASPGVFRATLPLRRRLAAVLGQGDNVFQPFVAPDTVGGRPRVFRVNVFLSPRYDLFLSVHAKIAGVPLPPRHPDGLTRDLAPYVVNFTKGATYERPEPEIEAELVDVVAELGDLVRSALEERFDLGPP